MKVLICFCRSLSEVGCCFTDRLDVAASQAHALVSLREHQERLLYCTAWVIDALHRKKYLETAQFAEVFGISGAAKVILQQFAMHQLSEYEFMTDCSLLILRIQIAPSEIYNIDFYLANFIHNYSSSFVKCM